MPIDVLHFAQTEAPAALHRIDLIVLLGSVLAVMLFGLYMGRREEGTRDFFLAGRSIAWWAVGASVFASNISSHHMVGMTGAGLKLGFAQANFEFGAILGLMMLCYVFLPLYRRMGIYTLSEYLGRRFDHRSQFLYSVCSMGFMLIQLCGALILGAIAVKELTRETAFETSYSAAVLGLAIVAAVYTVIGGLKAVIYTDVVQSILLLIGGILIAVLAINHPSVGGIGGLIEKEPEKFHVFFDHSHPDLPWTGVLTGLMILHFYYWGTNQFIVQRTLGAKTGWDGRIGIITAGFFKLLIPFITIVPGMAAAHFLAIAPEQSDTAFAALAKSLLPAGTGLIGLFMAGLVGAILSTVDSMMNSASTLFTFDIYKKYCNPEATERRLILVGRISMFAMISAAIALSLAFGGTEDNVFNTMVNYNAYLVPGLLICFLGGVFVRWATPTAAVCCIATGPIASVVLEQSIAGLQAFHRTGLAAAVCMAVFVVVSLITFKERDPQREQYLWQTYRYDPADADVAERPLWQNDRLWACVLVAATLSLVIYFF